MGSKRNWDKVRVEKRVETNGSISILEEIDTPVGIPLREVSRPGDRFKPVGRVARPVRPVAAVHGMAHLQSEADRKNRIKNRAAAKSRMMALVAQLRIAVEGFRFAEAAKLAARIQEDARQSQ